MYFKESASIKYNHLYCACLLARFFNIFKIFFSLILNIRIIASVSVISCDIRL